MSARLDIVTAHVYRGESASVVPFSATSESSVKVQWLKKYSKGRINSHKPKRFALRVHRNTSKSAALGFFKLNFLRKRDRTIAFALACLDPVLPPVPCFQERAS